MYIFVISIVINIVMRSFFKKLARTSQERLYYIVDRVLKFIVIVRPV